MKIAPRLDLFDQVRSTQAMIFFDTHVKCHGVQLLDAKKHLEQMARQRCVGANGMCTG
jgi:hypothetical protein